MKVKVKSILLAFCVITSAGLAGFSGCAGTQNKQSTGEYIDDKATNSRVKKALGDDSQYKFERVSVETFKGTVQLSGFVNTRNQRNKAADIAKGVPGVKEVVNNITVRE
jgi:osmotically-inducible protein OsmY